MTVSNGNIELFVEAVRETVHPYIAFTCLFSGNGDIKVIGYLRDQRDSTVSTVVEHARVHAYRGRIEGIADQVTDAIADRLIPTIVPDGLEIDDDENRPQTA